MNKADNGPVAGLRARWAKKAGSVKLTDILTDIMKSQELSLESKKQCFQYLASLIDVELEEKELNSLVDSLTIIEQENIQGKGGSLFKRPKTVQPSILKEFIGRSVPTYKFRDDPNIENIERLAGAMLAALAVKKQQLNFNEKSEIVDRVLNKAKSILNADPERFDILCDALRDKAKERGINNAAVDKLIGELKTVIITQRPITPTSQSSE